MRSSGQITEFYSYFQIGQKSSPHVKTVTGAKRQHFLQDKIHEYFLVFLPQRLPPPSHPPNAPPLLLLSVLKLTLCLFIAFTHCLTARLSLGLFSGFSFRTSHTLHLCLRSRLLCCLRVLTRVGPFTQQQALFASAINPKPVGRHQRCWLVLTSVNNFFFYP